MMLKWMRMQKNLKSPLNCVRMITDTKRRSNVRLTLVHRLRRSPNINLTLVQRLVFGGIPPSTKHLYNICTTSDQRLQRWSNILQML